MEHVERPADAAWQKPIYVVSLVVCVVVGLLLLGPHPPGVAGSVDVSHLPAVDASLNALTTVLLLAGYVAIRNQRIRVHKTLMLSAFGTSTLFLLSYVTYHWFSAGPKHYHGPLRGLYLVMLISHIVLAAAILPLALTTLARGLSGAIVRHRRIAPKTLVLWLYVSITGVLIFWALYG